MLGLSRLGFQVVFYDTLEEFYLAEALEYVNAWKQSTADNPVGICGPIGPTEQLPLVALDAMLFGFRVAPAIMNPNAAPPRAMVVNLLVVKFMENHSFIAYC